MKEMCQVLYFLIILVFNLKVVCLSTSTYPRTVASSCIWNNAFLSLVADSCLFVTVPDY